MNKHKIAAFVASLAMVAVPFASFAAVTINDGGMTINGQQVATVRAGNSFNMVFLADANSGDEIEFVRVTLLDLSNNLIQAPECKAINPRLVDVTNGQVRVNGVKTASDLPDSEVKVFVETFGETGLPQSQRCDDNNIGTDHTWEGRLFIDHSSSVSNADIVIGGSSSTGTGAGSADDMPSWIAALIAALTPKKPAVCTGLDAKVNAASPRKTTYANTVLQSHLIANGYAHVITYGATGFYGDQTTSAVTQAQAVCD